MSNLAYLSVVRSSVGGRELSHKREVIGSDPRNSGAMRGQAQWLECRIHENMIDGQRGKPRRESTDGPRRSNELAHIAQIPGKRAVG